MGAYFAQTLDQFKAIYVNLRSIYANLRSIYVNLRQFASKFDKISIQNVQITKYMFKHIRNIIFPEEKAPAGRFTTSHRACK